MTLPWIKDRHVAVENSRMGEKKSVKFFHFRKMLLNVERWSQACFQSYFSMWPNVIKRCKSGPRLVSNQISPCRWLILKYERERSTVAVHFILFLCQWSSRMFGDVIFTSFFIKFWWICVILVCKVQLNSFGGSIYKLRCKIWAFELNFFLRSCKNAKCQI